MTPGDNDGTGIGDDGAKPKLLFLCQTLPYPPHGGVEARTFNVLRLLSRAFDVTALCFFRNGGAVQGRVTEAVAALSRYARIEAFAIPQEWSRWRLAWDHARSVATGRVYTVFAYQSADFAARLRGLVASERFDLVHMDSMDLSGYLPLLDGLPVVCVHHNAESQLLARRAKVTVSKPVAAYMGLQAKLMAREEARSMRAVVLNVTVSPADAMTLERGAPGAHFHVVPNGVDVETFRPADAVAQDGVVFLGGTSWFPNFDGMEWFCAEILPLVRADARNLRVTWVGKATPAQREHFFRAHGIEMTGYVPDVAPYVHRASVFVAPLRIGGGTRLKILDAWAMGKAVVSTSVGCEGLRATDGHNIVVRDSAVSFADAIVALLADAPRRRSIGAAARATAEDVYSWEVIGSDMNASYLGLLGSSERVGGPIPSRTQHVASTR